MKWTLRCEHLLGFEKGFYHGILRADDITHECKMEYLERDHHILLCSRLVG